MKLLNTSYIMVSVLMGNNNLSTKMENQNNLVACLIEYGVLMSNFFIFFFQLYDKCTIVEYKLEATLFVQY